MKPLTKRVVLKFPGSRKLHHQSNETCKWPHCIFLRDVQLYTGSLKIKETIITSKAVVKSVLWEVYTL